MNSHAAPPSAGLRGLWCRCLILGQTLLVLTPSDQKKNKFRSSFFSFMCTGSDPFKIQHFRRAPLHVLHNSFAFEGLRLRKLQWKPSPPLSKSLMQLSQSHRPCQTPSLQTKKPVHPRSYVHVYVCTFHLAFLYSHDKPILGFKYWRIRLSTRLGFQLVVVSWFNNILSSFKNSNIYVYAPWL